jgi:hypothetical protein
MAKDRYKDVPLQELKVMAEILEETAFDLETQDIADEVESMTPEERAQYLAVEGLKNRCH